jgi:hypothetical protein
MTDALCDDLRPEFVGVVDALAALKTVSDKKRTSPRVVVALRDEEPIQIFQRHRQVKCALS